MIKIYQTIKIQKLSLDEILDKTSDKDHVLNQEYVSCLRMALAHFLGDTVDDYDSIDVEKFIYGLSLDESRALLYLSLGLKQTHISAALGVGKSRVSRIVHQLKQKAKLFETQ